jgi:acetolactate synthase I/III small subunit
MAARRAITALPTRCLRPAVSIRRSSSSSSTQALAYKALHRRIAPLPTDSPSSWSAPAAVSSILYETPLPSSAPPKRHVLNCLVQNEPGVLSRVSGILAARGFNIDSLVVCNTEVEDLSRMTIVLQGQDGVVEQARRQLEDLVPVWAVLDYTDAPLVQRELLLAKISILGPEYFEELLAHHREMVMEPISESLGATAEDPRSDSSISSSTHSTGNAVSAETNPVSKAEREMLRDDFHPSKLAVSQALRHKHEHLEAITHLTHQFGGKVLDISTNNCIVEISAKPTRIDSFLKLIAPFGILESARTGNLICSQACGQMLTFYPRSHGPTTVTLVWPDRGRRKRSARCCGSKYFATWIIKVLTNLGYTIHGCNTVNNTRLTSCLPSFIPTYYRILCCVINSCYMILPLFTTKPWRALTAAHRRFSPSWNTKLRGP